jgi:hypothetical protein
MHLDRAHAHAKVVCDHLVRLPRHQRENGRLSAAISTTYDDITRAGERCSRSGACNEGGRERCQMASSIVCSP